MQHKLSSGVVLGAAATHARRGQPAGRMLPPPLLPIPLLLLLLLHAISIASPGHALPRRCLARSPALGLGPRLFAAPPPHRQRLRPAGVAAVDDDLMDDGDADLAEEDEEEWDEVAAEELDDGLTDEDRKWLAGLP